MIEGTQGKLTAPRVAMDPAGDHRMAMTFAVAALASEGTLRLLDPACASVSYPGFFSTLAELGATIEEAEL